MSEKYLKLNDIDAYKISFRLSNYVWNVILKWDNFQKRTVGEQFIHLSIRFQRTLLKDLEDISKRIK